MTPTDVRGEPFAVLGMYPFPALRPAWEQLFAAASDRVRARGGAAPAGLRWDVDPHLSWLHAGLAVGMSCGWPLVTALREQVRVVGTFAYRSERAPKPHLYRTVVVARRACSLAELASSRAAVNADDSLSGNVSLLEVFGIATTWPSEVVTTEAHVRSLEAVRTGGADVASIDGMTWVYQQRDEPSTVEGLHVVARGPWVPGLPLILPASASNAELEEWRAAFTAVVTDPAFAGVMDELLIDAFVPLDLADYDQALAGLRERHPLE